MKIGDLVYQTRPPGGLCLIIEVYETPIDNPSGKGWITNDYPILKVLHPTEMLIEDPSYYYKSVEDYEHILEQSRMVGEIEIHRAAKEKGEDEDR